MKKNIKKLTLAYLASLLALGGTAWARQPEVRHEDISVARGETLRGDVATDKSVTVEGTLDGDAMSLGGGTVTVSGELTGDLVSMGGPVSIPGRVRGDVSSIGGPVEISGLGMCGKGHKEWVKVTDGGPYLKLQARLA